VTSEALAETENFITRRLQGVLLDAGFAYDIVEAVLAARGNNPTSANRACAALSRMVAAPGWSEDFTAYARCARITRALSENFALQPDRYQEDVEHKLHSAYLDAAATLAQADEPADLLGAQLQKLQAPINDYFEKVLVNVDDPALRSARLGLIQHIAALPSSIADLSKLQGF
jgi:glycyl-tRNA synthetase